MLWIGDNPSFPQRRAFATARAVVHRRPHRADDADVIGDEPIWHDGKVVGWMTSGGYAHHVGQSLAQGYIPAELADLTTSGAFEVEMLGERRAARLEPEPVFDPSAGRMKM